MADSETPEMPEESLASDNILEVSEISSQDNRNVDGETCTPSIILDSGGESNMESATEVLRESSPRNERRPKLMRQSSVEMQQAVDVQRPLTSDRKKSTSLCIPTEATAGVTTEDDTYGETKERTTSFGGLSTDSNTDTWKHSQLENSEEDQEDFPAETPKILSLEAPSYSSIASKPKPAVFEEENIAEPPKVIEGKCDFKETFVFVDEKETEETDEKDEEGYEIALTRKHKRERKSSKRLSTSCEDFNENENLTKKAEMRQNDDLAIEGKEKKKTISTSLLNIEKTRLNNIARDNFWVNKYLFDDAEENYFLRLKRNPKTPMAEDDTKKEDDDDNDDKDTKKEEDNNQDFKEANDDGVDDDEEDREAEEPNSDYNWSDESTFLKPNIPILKPLTFKMTSSDLNPIHIEEQVSRTAQNLSSVIQQHVTVNSGTVSQSVMQNTSLQVHIVPSHSIPFFPFQSTF